MRTVWSVMTMSVALFFSDSLAAMGFQAPQRLCPWYKY